MQRSELSKTLAEFRRSQAEPDTLGGSHLAGLRRAIAVLAGLSALCATLGAAAVVFGPSRSADLFDTSSEARPSKQGATDLFGADERLFLRRPPR